MSGVAKELPLLWKNRDEYTIEDAAWLWVYTLGQDAPLNPDWKEKARYKREYREALQELQRNVKATPGERHVEKDGSRDVREIYRDNPGDRPPVTESRPYDYFRGEDLAEYAARCGFPGLFGFEEPETPKSGKGTIVSSREEHSILHILAAVIESKYGTGSVAKMKEHGSELTGTVHKLVESYGFKMDPKTVRGYLKRLPEIPARKI
jgi:hypothetical protein